MFRRFLIAPVVLGAACGHRASSAGVYSPPSSGAASTVSAPASVVILQNGPNSIDLLGDGTRSEVFVAWRGNYNAHGRSTVAFYLLGKSDLGDSPIWQAVPFFGGSSDADWGEEFLTTSEGADCALGDIRVLRDEHKPVEVVVARRSFKKSFADAEPVRFEYYALARNANGAVGFPPYYFQHSRTVAAKRDYCDVNEAFDRELGLGAKGLSAHGDGGR